MSDAPKIPTFAEACAAERCVVCGAAKTKGRPLCPADWLALTWQRRRDLDTAGTAEQVFPGVFTFLKNLPDRKPHRAWRFRSHEELVDAGFRRLDHGQCRSPRCLMTVWWYVTPHGNRMPIDPATAKPHADVCKDPTFLERKQVYLDALKAKKAKARAAKRTRTMARRRA